MTSPPPLTVLMPVRNGARHVREAIDSVLAQSFGDFELVVVDDGSADETPAILTDYAVRDPRLRLIRNETSVGVANALNRGLAAVRSPIVARMDADDVCLPGRFERQLEVLEARPDVGVLGCQTRFIDEDGSLSPQAPWEQPTSFGVLVWHLLYSSPICHPSATYRTEVVRAVGGYRAEYPNEDTDLWSRLVLETRLVNLDETLLDYRMPPDVHREKARAWRPHSLRVGREHAERILGRAVDPRAIEILYDFHRQQGLDPSTDPFDVFRLCSLLRDLLAAMTTRLRLDAAEKAELEAVAVSQAQRLITGAYAALETRNDP